MAAATPIWSHGGAQHDGRPAPPEAAGQASRPAQPGSPAGQHEPRKREAPGPGGSSAARPAARPAAAALPLQSGKPRQSRPAWKLATWAPKRMTTKPSAAGGQHQPVVAVALPRATRAGPPGSPARSADHDQRSQQHHRVGQMGDDHPGRERQLDRDRAQQDLHHQQNDASVAGVPKRGSSRCRTPGHQPPRASTSRLTSAAAQR